jgi:predicted GH43/DUF377 family glycosyl hydrolase
MAISEVPTGIVAYADWEIANMVRQVVLELILALFVSVATLRAQETAKPIGVANPTLIDIDHADAPLFDDATWHGASDPFVIWNPVRGEWFMYYTQRRATLGDAHGVDWVHGSAIGVAASKDGARWKFVGTCQGDHDLSEPLKARGVGPKPGITWWAPCLVHDDGVFHMFVTRVDGVYTDWKGARNIVHFTSNDGIDWKYADTCQLASDRVIDPTVYKIGDTWYMVYKNEAAGSYTFRSQSKDLHAWTDPTKVSPDGSHEAPFVFRWRDSWWLIVDAASGLRVYRSDNGIDGWKYVSTVLARGGVDGQRNKDRGQGHHPGIVVQIGPDGSEQCLVFYFTHQGKQTVIQLAELELDAEGKVVCNRDKYEQRVDGRQ